MLKMESFNLGCFSLIVHFPNLSIIYSIDLINNFIFLYIELSQQIKINSKNPDKIQLNLEKKDFHQFIIN
jgi:hypothetical protein